MKFRYISIAVIAGLFFVIFILSEHHSVVDVHYQTEAKSQGIIHLVDTSSRSINSETALLPVSIDSPSLHKQLDSLQLKTDLQQALLSDWEKYNRYPPQNQLISSPEQDPIDKLYRPDKRTTVSEDGQISVTVWSDKKFYLRGESILLYARLLSLSEDGGRVPILGEKLDALLIYNDTENLGVVEFTPLLSDNVYMAKLSVDNYQSKAIESGMFKVIVQHKKSSTADSIAFTLADQVGDFTGNYRDSLTDEGNLILEAQVDIKDSARYYFQASLYNSPQDSIGSSQYAVTLTSGLHWIPFSFHGLMIHDAGQDGPYLLQYVSIAKVTMPMQRGNKTYANYYTAGYTLTQFNQSPFRSVE